MKDFAKILAAAAAADAGSAFGTRFTAMPHRIAPTPMTTTYAAAALRLFLAKLPEGLTRP